MALAATRRALAIDSTVAYAHMNLATYYRIVQDTVRRRGEIEWLSRAQPNVPEPLLTLGADRLRRGDTTEAVRMFRRALAADPRNPGIMSSVAYWFAFAGQYGEALELLNRVIALEPGDAQGHLNLAQIHLLQGRRDSAKAAIDRGFQESGSTSVLLTAAQTPSIRMLRVFREEYGAAMRSLPAAVFGADSVDFYYLRAIAYWAVPSVSRTYYDSLAHWAKPRVDRGGDRNPLINIFYLIGLAGSGHRDVALAEAARILGSGRYDWLHGGTGDPAYNRAMLAEAYVLAGDYERAIDQIEAGLAVGANPAMLNRSWLELDPIWDPLRQLPRFAKLLR
jgi:serine/threonine-protein kinase